MAFGQGPSLYLTCTWHKLLDSSYILQEMGSTELQPLWLTNSLLSQAYSSGKHLQKTISVRGFLQEASVHISFPYSGMLLSLMSSEVDF